MTSLARYQSDGTLDPSFSGDGRQTTDFPRLRPGDGANVQFDYGRALALQSDGKVVVAGSSDSPGYEGHVFALARYDTAGTLDTAFSNDGRQTGPGAIGHAIAIDLDGRVVVAGSSQQGYGDNFSLARFDSDGTPDRSFSRDGTLTSSFGTSNPSGARGRAVIIQPDAKIVVAGDSDQGATDLDFALARYGPDGTLDGEFVEPVLSGLRLDPARFVASRTRGAGRAGSRAGTRVSYTLSEAAQVRFSLDRGRPGRRSVRGFCTAPRPANRRNEVCTRYQETLGSFARSGRPGRNAFRFTGRLSGLALSPGPYRLVAVPTDLANNVGRRRRASFMLTGWP